MPNKVLISVPPTMLIDPCYRAFIPPPLGFIPPPTQPTTHIPPCVFGQEAGGRQGCRGCWAAGSRAWRRVASWPGPITEGMELHGNLHGHETGARNTLVARGHVENGQPPGYGWFEALIPVQALQRVCSAASEARSLEPQWHRRKLNHLQCVPSCYLPTVW